MTASAEKFTRQTLLDVQPLTPGLFTLRTTRDAGFRFRAGQFARLGVTNCLLYTSPSPRDGLLSRMPSSA